VRQPWGLTRPSWRVELLILMLGFILIVVASVIGYQSWRRQSHAEALLVLRDEFWRQTRGEQRRISRWRAWARRRLERSGQSVDL
jgi:type II secretory pathway component PulL